MLLSLLAVLLLAPAAVAGIDTAPRREVLKGRLQPIVPRGRSNAPIAADVELDWEGRRLLEGTLHITIRDGNEVLGRYRSAEMALTAGTQSFRMLLPAMTSPGTGRNSEASLRFVGRKKVYDLGRHPLFLPSHSIRTLVIGVVQPGRRSGTLSTSIAQSMRLERFDPVESDASERAMSTYAVYVSPEDLPTYPTGYCTFDVILLTGEGFRMLRARQLRALGRWVRAGGSVCAAPVGKLGRRHAELINDLAGKQGPLFMPDDAGAFEMSAPLRSSMFRTFHSDLGRTVVACRPEDWEKSLDTAAWRRAAAFLWKVRAAHMVQAAEEGTWKKRPEQQKRRTRRDRYGRPRYSYGTPPRFTHVPIQFGDDFLSSVLPRRIRLIPLWLITFILVLFVLAVAPGDYTALGLLRRRAMTWVSFPVISIAFMLFTLQVAKHYLGAADQRGAVEFVDVGRGGRALRKSRIEVVFAAQGKVIRTRVKRGLFASLDLKRFEKRRHWRDSTDLDTSIASYEGRIPVHFTAGRPVKQWTPWCNRTFFIGANEEVPRLAWDAVGPDRTRLADELLGSRDFDGVIYLLQGDKLRSVYGDAKELFGPRFNLISFLRQVCVRPGHGLFHIVSCVSPTGGSNFEDLAVLDSTDPSQQLVVAITRRGRDYVVYRRLYQGAK